LDLDHRHVFQDGETLWGIGSIVFFPIAFIYGVMNFGEAKIR
jgi:hypothetical protein